MSSFEVLACQCANGLGRNFLSNINRFDAVVLGTFNISEQEFKYTFTVNKVYKGNIQEEEIELLSGGTDCYHYLDFENGTQLILGLVESPYSGQPDAFMAFGCTTSAVIVNQEKVFTPEQQLPMFKKPKIGIFRRKMKLKHLENRIRRKIWWNNLF